MLRVLSRIDNVEGLHDSQDRQVCVRCHVRGQLLSCVVLAGVQPARRQGRITRSARLIALLVLLLLFVYRGAAAAVAAAAARALVLLRLLRLLALRLLALLVLEVRNIISVPN